MKQMQTDKYHLTRKLNLEIQQLDDDEVPLTPGMANKVFCSLFHVNAPVSSVRINVISSSDMNVGDVVLPISLCL